MEFRFVPRTIHAKRAKPISTFSEYDHLLFLDECALGNLEVVNDLLARGADVNRPDKFSRTPLNQACCGGHLDVVLTLIKHGADVNSFQLWWTPLTAACFYGHLHVALALIEHGADVKKCSNKGAPPLAAACVFGHLNLVKLLVRHGDDVNRPTDKGVTPLFAACKLGHLEIVKVFLQHNANTKVECYGYTPLDIAMKNGHTSIVNVLRHGLTKEDTDNRGKRTEPVNRNVRELRRNLTAPTHQSSRYISKYSEKGKVTFHVLLIEMKKKNLAYTFLEISP